MNIMEMMNYRFENPNENVLVDTKIAEKFISRDRDNIDSFALWASMSKENVSELINGYITERQVNIGITK